MKAPRKRNEFYEHHHCRKQLDEPVRATAHVHRSGVMVCQRMYSINVKLPPKWLIALG
jgi:hypothetical protein